MSELNKRRFAMLLEYTHSHPQGVYFLYDYELKYIEATYDTDYESDNGLEDDEEGFEEFHSIIFKRLVDSTLFEVNYHKIHVKAVCDGNVIYD